MELFDYPPVFLKICFLTFILVLVSWYWRRHQRLRFLPPGPLGLPLLGNLMTIVDKDQKVQQRIMALGQAYGGIFSLYLGRCPTVWITSYELFHEALVHRGWDCADRPPELPQDYLDQSGKKYRHLAHSGVTPVDREIRDFVTQHLKNLGFGKNRMQSLILSEVNHLIQELQLRENTPVNPGHLFAQAAASITTNITLGRRFDYDDDEILAAIKSFSEGVRLLMKTKLDDFFPFLKHVPRKCRKECRENFQIGVSFLTKIVDDNKKTWLEGNPRNLMDVWIDRWSESNDERMKAIFDLDRLPMVLLALFLASYDTTAVTFSWLFAVLLNNPDIQTKVQDEIDTNVPSGDVTLSHVGSLLYTEAVILETMRMYPAAPFAIPHYTINDTQIGAYKIPKGERLPSHSLNQATCKPSPGTRIALHLYSIHHDETLWIDPHRFRPERFIVDGKVKIPEYFVAFSQGRRACMGEKLARKQLFLMFANLMQKMSIAPTAADQIPSLDLITRGLVMHPPAFELTVKMRHGQ